MYGKNTVKPCYEYNIDTDNIYKLATSNVFFLKSLQSLSFQTDVFFRHVFLDNGKPTCLMFSHQHIHVKGKINNF